MENGRVALLFCAVGSERKRRWLLKNSPTRKRSKRLCNRRPHDRRSLFWQTFSIPTILAILTKKEFFNSHEMLRQPMSLESGSEQWDNAGMKRVSLFFDRKKGIYRCSACDWVKDLRRDGARRKRDDKSMIRAVFIEFNSHRYVCPRVHTQSKTDPPPRKLVQS